MMQWPHHTWMMHFWQSLPLDLQLVSLQMSGSGNSSLSGLRVLRAFRVLRLFKLFRYVKVSHHASCRLCQMATAP